MGREGITYTYASAQKKESDIEALEKANKIFRPGWLRRIAQALGVGVIITAVTGLYWVGIGAAGFWVIVLRIKDIVGPNQFENGREFHMRIPNWLRRKKRK